MTPPEDVRCAAVRIWVGNDNQGDADQISQWLGSRFSNTPTDPERCALWVLSFAAGDRAVTRWRSVKEWLRGGTL